MSDSASQFRHGIRHGHQQLAILNRSISYHFEFAQGFANGGFADPKARGGCRDRILELTALATQRLPILVGELGQCGVIGAPRPRLPSRWRLMTSLKWLSIFGSNMSASMLRSRGSGGVSRNLEARSFAISFGAACISKSCSQSARQVSSVISRST